MKKNDIRQPDDNFIEQKIAEAFGYTDEQLAQELDRFVEEAEKSDDKALDAPEGEFQRIWDRVEKETGREPHKGGRVRRLVKVMAVAAILGTMVLGGGMWVGAKRYYVYEVRERKDLDNVIVLNNSSDNLITDDFLEEEKAYNQIKEELSMEVFELSYLPEGMTINELKLFKTKSRLDFIRKPEWLYFYQGVGDKPSSLSYASDMKEYASVYNAFLDVKIPVYGKELEDGDVEFSIRIIRGNSYYIVQGIIDIEEFIKVVSGIRSYGK